MNDTKTSTGKIATKRHCFVATAMGLVLSYQALEYTPTTDLLPLILEVWGPLGILLISVWQPILSNRKNPAS
jgi:hypothetical protein